MRGVWRSTTNLFLTTSTRAESAKQHSLDVLSAFLSYSSKRSIRYWGMGMDETGNQAHQNCLSDPGELSDDPSEEA